METLNILRLHLFSPLYYTRAGELEPPDTLPPGEERLFCFDIAPALALSIEPEGRDYPGPLVFRGKCGPESPSAAGAEKETPPEQVELPPGKYLFAQERRLLNREDALLMAIEVQKEGLWERLALEPRLYLRYLSEDNAWVTQVFRPFTEDSGMCSPGG